MASTKPTKPTKTKKQGGYTWTDVTDTFSEEQRHYKDTYLEIDELYNMDVEISLFSRQDGPYEICIWYGLMYGIVYAEAEKAVEVRERIKKDIEKVYDGPEDPTEEFILLLEDKYDIQFPDDTLF